MRMQTYATRAALIMLLLLGPALAGPVSGTAEVAGSPALKVMDGWVAPDCTPRFLNVYLVPYPCPKHILESGKPYVQVCAWFQDQPDLKQIQMATLTIYGVGSKPENKYTFNDANQARRFLQQLQAQKTRWRFASSMKAVTSPYPGVSPGSWNLDVTVEAPSTR